MDMTSFAPEEFFGGQIGVHRKTHTQNLEFFRITQLELRSLEPTDFLTNFRNGHKVSNHPGALCLSHKSRQTFELFYSVTSKKFAISTSFQAEILSYLNVSQLSVLVKKTLLMLS